MPRPADPMRRPNAPPPRRRLRLTWALGVAASALLAVLGLALLNPSRPLTGEDWAQVGYSIGFIVLVASSLAARQLQLGQAIRYGLFWISMFALLLVGYAFRHDLRLVAQRLGLPVPGEPAAGRRLEMTLNQAADGRFYVAGAVDDVPVRFVVDPDASDIALAPLDARRAGVDLAKLRYDAHFETPSGMGQGAAFLARTLSVGPAHLQRVSMWVNRTAMPNSFIGLNFLPGLESYQVRGSKLYLSWRP